MRELNAATTTKPTAKKAVTANTRRAMYTRVPSSPQALKLRAKIVRSRARVKDAQGRINAFKSKVRTARAAHKTSGDKRTLRSLEGAAEKLSILQQKLDQAKRDLRELQGSLTLQKKADVAEAKRNATRALALKQFKRKWLLDYDTKQSRKVRSAKNRRGR